MAIFLVPNAASIFKKSLRDERIKTGHARRAAKLLRRKEKTKQQENCRINRLVAALLQSLRIERTNGSVFPPPHWTGEPRPQGAQRVRLHSQFPSTELLRHLVTDLGYDGAAAFSSVSRPMNPKPDRRRLGCGEIADGQQWYNYQSIAQPILYIAAATRRTDQGYLSRESVLNAVARMRTNDKMRLAVMEVVYRRQSPTKVAKNRRLNLATLKKYSTRIRQRISRGLSHNEINTLEGEVSTIFHYSERD